MVHGICCAHVICGHIETNKQFRASAFSNQWAQYHEDHTNSLDPEVFNTLPPFGILKAQARKRLHRNAKKRQSSGFMRAKKWISDNKCSHSRESVTNSAIAILVSSSSQWIQRIISPMNTFHMPLPSFQIMNTPPTSNCGSSSPHPTSTSPLPPSL
uniref:Uncharacterized protein n=1 Tax=Hyaloperonospora arabidopsidis (strain Emoy2) TaxID=559515 RepID=M4BB63_HYAAE